MDEMLIIFAGEEAPSVSLAECIRQMHKDTRAGQLERRGAQASLGIVDAGVNAVWDKARALSAIVAGAVEEKNRGAAAKALHDLELAMAEVPELLPEEAVVPKWTETIRITMASISELDRRTIGGRLATTFSALDRARAEVPAADLKDPQAWKDDRQRRVDELAASAYQAQRELVRLTLKRIVGLKRPGPNGGAVDAGEMLGPQIDNAFLDGLKRAGAFDVLFMVCDRFQVLPPGKAVRFGLPLQ